MLKEDLPVNKRDFKGIWIPANIWKDQRLTYFERCLYAEIDSLNGEDGCFASNKYFCDFFQERERIIQNGISKLKALGYIYLESFDGRNRVLRVGSPPKTDKSLFSTSALPNFTPQTCKKTTAPHIIYNKEDNKDNNSPLSPQISEQETANAVSAEADEKKVLIPPEEKPKRTKKSSDFTPRVKELSDKMVNLLVSANPDWLLPKNLHAFMSQVDLMLNHDKRDAERVLNVFLWAISDSFWIPIISTNNPAKYLRDSFAKLAAKMDQKPSIKPNTFCVSSKPSEALKTIQQMKSRSI